MKLTWYGHSAFRIEAGDAKILIDPFLTGNSSWGKGWDEAAEGVTHVLLTHGHNDHLGDALPNKVNPGNHGGTVDCGGFTTTFVNAIHSSSFSKEGGGNVYLGNPNGLVLHFSNGESVYHMGDTDIFGDMALINELHQPKIGLVPIGDRFTMGGAVAAMACQRFFDFETVVPCHYGTFPIIDQNADKFVEGMKGTKAKVLVPKIGEASEI
jgi:L-ascorbate metabolism protein UlaG (beta-lactamase superfamily)